MDVLDDLIDEYDRLESVLVGLDGAAWQRPSAAPGWTIRDVVVHLAQTEELVTISIAGGAGQWRERESETLDEAIDRNVLADRSEPSDVLARWQAARRASVAALRTADPDVAVAWAAAPLRPRTLAITRLAEHWAHALDITTPLAIDLPDTARLRHIAWLAHRTLPYAFRVLGEEPRDVRCVLAGPGGEVWQFGPPGCTSVITGDAGAFCRVGARRLSPDASGLVTEGPYASAALSVLRNYAA